jgi:hypothetical protein
VGLSNLSLVCALAVLTAFHAEPASGRTVQLTMETRLDGRVLHVDGDTDLPDLCRIEWELRHNELFTSSISNVDNMSAEGHVFVMGRQFHAEIDLTRWPAGAVEVWVAFQPVAFGTPQPAIVSRLFGEQGEHLEGSNISSAGSTNDLRRVVLVRNIVLQAGSVQRKLAGQSSAPTTSPSAPAMVRPPAPLPRRGATIERSSQAELGQGVEVAPAQPSASSVAEDVRGVLVPAGTAITVRLLDSISSRNRAGQLFRATVAQPVGIVSNPLIPRGADAVLKLIPLAGASSPNHAVLGLDLVALRLNGTYLEVSTTASDSDSTSSPKKGRRPLLNVARDLGVGASLGALTGGAFGGAEGAAVGAATGAGTSLIRRVIHGKNRPLEVASEAQMTFTLAEPLVLAPTASRTTQSIR